MTKLLPRKFSGLRGVALIDDLIAVAVIGLVIFAVSPSSTPGKTYKWQFWKKNPIEQVQKSQEQVDKEKVEIDAAIAVEVAKLKVEKDKQFSSAHESSVATVAAIAAAQQTTASGTLPTKELETAKKTADLTKSALDEATGTTVAPARIRELEQMVTNLNAGVAAGTKALETMQTVLDASVAREKALKEESEKIKKDGEAKVKAAEELRDQKVTEANKWAIQRDAVARTFENYKFWGSCVVILLILAWIASWALPILSKSFPAVAGIADTFGKVWAPGLQMTHNAATALNEDFVAMTEMLKAKLAEKATPAEMEALKKEISTEWMTVHDGSAQMVDKVKAKLRL